MNKIKKLSQMIGILNFVILSLEDRKITQGNPSDRRKFLDYSISQVEPDYLENLQIMKRLLLEKIAIIKNESFNEDIFSITNIKLAEVFSNLIKQRNFFVSRLNPFFKEFYSLIQDGSELVELEYRPNIKSINQSTV